MLALPKTVRSALDLIGNTPMLEVTNIDTGRCRLFLKLESQNPGGSIKDRIGVTMIEDAEAKGLLKPGGTLVEATAGNTGLGLALVAILRGYKMIIVVPDKMAREKIYHCAPWAPMSGSLARMWARGTGLLSGYRRADRHGNRRVLREPVWQSGQPAGP